MTKQPKINTYTHFWNQIDKSVKWKKNKTKNKNENENKKQTNKKNKKTEQLSPLEMKWLSENKTFSMGYLAHTTLAMNI